MCSAYCSLFDAHTGEPLCRDQASEDAAYLAASRLLLGAKLGHRSFHRTPSSSQPPSPTSIPQECDESRDRCTFSDPILISSFAPDSSEASLLQKTASCERALATKSAHLAWLAFRREVVRRRAAYIKSIALLDPECPILKLRREDLLPELETLVNSLETRNGTRCVSGRAGICHPGHARVS
ncbi:hypothetical protein BC830DRAFT_157942 [Chytriomyces sp. MP71]|nr:hypothetical protein BC830DRAFT_157942 [Chytriomyces sp. MP71]